MVRTATVYIEKYEESTKYVNKYGQEIKEYEKKERCTVVHVLEEMDDYYKVKLHSWWIFNPFGEIPTRCIYLNKITGKIMPSDEQFTKPNSQFYYCNWWQLEDLPPIKEEEENKNDLWSVIDWIKSF